jgi:hypothetical protein
MVFLGFPEANKGLLIFVTPIKRVLPGRPLVRVRKHLDDSLVKKRGKGSFRFAWSPSSHGEIIGKNKQGNQGKSRIFPFIQNKV